MVSNSGTRFRLMLGTPPCRRSRPLSLASSASARMSDTVAQLEMMHWLMASTPNSACTLAASRKMASSFSLSAL
ncbi:hypothetical protein D3C85_1897840 [compost metagenome]